MGFDVEDRTYQDLLARVLESGAKVVPFVGAGLTAYGSPADRLPLWRGLLERLIEEGKRLSLIDATISARISRLLDAGSYISATDRILEALGEPTFRRVVERELDDKGKPTPPAVAELVAIGWSLIVTTNLDRLVARAYLERYGRPMRAVTSLDTRGLAAAIAGTLASSETTLAQIHGELDVYPSWRLTSSHYRQLLQDPGYTEALKHLFLRQLFFVGFGLQDDDFDFLLDTIASIYPAGFGEFYALIERSRMKDPALLALIQKIGLRPIFYDLESPSGSPDPFGGHRQAYECLSHLAAAWAKTRTGLPITLKYFPEPAPSLVPRDEEIKALGCWIERKGGNVVQIVGFGGLGKTSLVHQYLLERRPQIASAGYSQVFGCSFYRADIGQFVNDLAFGVVGCEETSLPQQVDRVCGYLERRRTLLILDGLEGIIDDERHLTSPYLEKILAAGVAGDGSILVTSRVPVRGGIFEHAPLVELEPLSSTELAQFLGRWGLAGRDRGAGQRVSAVTGGHPLALRILAGVLATIPAAEASRKIEASPVVEISDEVDPLRENRLARVLGGYLRHLQQIEIAFLMSWTAFDIPAPYPLVERALRRPYPDTTVNAPLTSIDLRIVVASLLERRLLTTSDIRELSGHPTGPECFSERARTEGHSLAPIHRFLAGESLREAPELPETFEEALPLLVACRHAAAAGDWTLFDDIFRRRLMRGFRLYLSENLGAWEETLQLARLGDTASFPARLSAEPCFYPINVARALKHLGRSAEARDKYTRTLAADVAPGDPEAAMYVNNFLTLLIWRGELNAADQLAELNVRALSWITEPWKRYTQIEHGFSSLGYLRLLQGDVAGATLLFDYAERAWDDYPAERLWFFDYYPYYRAEADLLSDPGAHDLALDRVESLLAVARDYNWPESICRGHIQAALVYLHRAERNGEPRHLLNADQRLEQAAQIAEGMLVPDVRLAHILSRIKYALLIQDLRGESDVGGPQLPDLIDGAEALVESSGLALAMPEVVAARGALAYLSGDLATSLAMYNQALGLCATAGNQLGARSSRSAIAWLGRHLGLSGDPEPTSPAARDLVGLVGAPLSKDWMLERLRTVTATDR